MPVAAKATLRSKAAPARAVAPRNVRAAAGKVSPARATRRAHPPPPRRRRERNGAAGRGGGRCRPGGCTPRCLPSEGLPRIHHWSFPERRAGASLCPARQPPPTAGRLASGRRAGRPPVGPGPARIALSLWLAGVRLGTCRVPLPQHSAPARAAASPNCASTRRRGSRAHCAPPQDVESAVSEAKTTCADGSSAECAAAWDVVEEISAANSHAKAKAKARAPARPEPLPRDLRLALWAPCSAQHRRATALHPHLARIGSWAPCCGALLRCALRTALTPPGTRAPLFRRAGDARGPSGGFLRDRAGRRRVPRVRGLSGLRSAGARGGSLGALYAASFRRTFAARATLFA